MEDGCEVGQCTYPLPQPTYLYRAQVRVLVTGRALLRYIRIMRESTKPIHRTDVAEAVFALQGGGSGIGGKTAVSKERATEEATKGDETVEGAETAEGLDMATRDTLHQIVQGPMFQCTVDKDGMVTFSCPRTLHLPRESFVSLVLEPLRRLVEPKSADQTEPHRPPTRRKTAL